jgi:predicted metalloprotease
MNGPHGRRAAVGFLAAIALIGCARSEPPPETAQVGAAVAALQAAAPQQGSQPPPSEEELIADMDVAVQVINDYWTRHWSEFFTLTYQPPTVWGMYDSSTGGGPTCGGAPAPKVNAFYCATGEDFLAWDRQLMLQGGQFGDGWVYLIIAHEWGHAVQFRLNTSVKTQSDELQADCFAGAVLYGAVRDGTLAFEEGDEKEFANALTYLADQTPWTSQADHGSAFQRLEFFAQGKNGGVNACLPM